MYYTLETLLNHVFEDIRKMKAPNIGVTIFRRSDDSIAFRGVLEGQLYLVDFNKAELDTCLIAKT
jgi:hypothetical protein